MNQFTVPQFIDVEDKIFGPITTRQFIILLVGALLTFIAFKLADAALFIFLLALIGGSTLVIAFVKINGQPFHYFILNLIQTIRRPSRRLWNKRYTKQELQEIMKAHAAPEAAEKPEEIKRPTHHRIRDLSLLVNTGGYFKPE